MKKFSNFLNVVNFINKLKYKKFNDKIIFNIFNYFNANLWGIINTTLTYDLFFYSKLKKKREKTFFKKIFFLYFELMYDLLIKFILMILIKNNFKKNNKKRILIFSVYTNWIKNENSKKDYFWNDIIGSLKEKNFEIMTTHSINSPFSNLKPAIERIIYEKNYVKHVPLNYFWNFKIRKKELVARKYFKAIKFKTKNSSISNNFLNFFFKYYISFVVKNIELCKKIVNTLKPDLILLMNESSIFGRALISASNEKNIPSVAIQHGIICEINKGYCFKASTDKEKKLIQKNILPTKTCVFNKPTKNLLLKQGSYSPNQIMITGNPRYDKIEKIKKFKKIDFKKKFNIFNNKIVLWTTSWGIPLKEEEKYIKCMDNYFFNNKKFKLIIKIHPRDQNKKCLNLYKKMRCKPLIYGKKYDILELIYVSDLVIIRNSTSGLEASLFDKRLIVLNFSEEKDFLDYVNKGIALGVYKASELEKSIKKCFFNKEIINNLKNQRKKYNKIFNYKNDSNAKDRMMKIIERLIKK